MTAVNLKALLSKANKNNYAVAGLVVITWEDALAYTEAADETGIPVILQAGPSCRASRLRMGLFSLIATCLPRVP